MPKVPETMLWSNVSLASKVLRLLGYVPGSQMPLDFGGAVSDYSLKGTRFDALTRVEAAAAGPEPLSLRDQRQQVALGQRKASDVSWHASPVAGLLPQKAARPPTPKARAKLHKKQLSAGRSGVVAGIKNLTLVFPSGDGPRANSPRKPLRTGRGAPAARGRGKLPRRRAGAALGMENLTLVLPSSSTAAAAKKRKKRAKPLPTPAARSRLGKTPDS